MDHKGNGKRITDGSLTKVLQKSHRSKVHRGSTKELQKLLNYCNNCSNDIQSTANVILQVQLHKDNTEASDKILVQFAHEGITAKVKAKGTQKLHRPAGLGEAQQNGQREQIDFI